MNLKGTYKKKKWNKLALFLAVLFALLAVNHFSNGKISSITKNLASPMLSFAGKTANLETKASLERKLQEARSRVAELEKLAYKNALLQYQLAQFEIFANSDIDKEQKYEPVRRVSSVTKDGTILVLLENKKATPSVVLDKYGFAIGKVIDIEDKIVTVKLFSSPGEVTDVVIISGDNSIQAKAVGEGTGNFVIELPAGVEVAEDALVFLPELQLPIAKVGAVVAKPQNAFIHLYARVPENIMSQVYFFAF